MTDLEGSYHKPEGEDLASIVEGMLGFKGRVHLHFGERVEGEFADAEALACEIDRHIVSGLKVFPTHLQAARLAGLDDLPVGGTRRCAHHGRFRRAVRELPGPAQGFSFRSVRQSGAQQAAVPVTGKPTLFGLVARIAQARTSSATDLIRAKSIMPGASARLRRESLVMRERRVCPAQSRSTNTVPSGASWSR